MIVVEPNEVKFFTKQETLSQLLQEESIDILSPVNNVNYYPRQGA